MILIAGHCCPDDVYYVLKYPAEDSTVGSRTEHNRCTKQSWERGGNASNNATVLACLGASVEYFGTLADDNLLSFLQEDMTSLGIKHDNCPIIQCGGNGPISVVICSEETGSRTIVHAKGNLTELSLQHFETKLDINQYSWIHFEGRNETVLPSILQYISAHNSQHKTSKEFCPGDLPNYKTKLVPVSVEIEKHRASLECLLPLADVVLVGKDFAMLQGAKDCMEAAKIISRKVAPGTVVVCPWGDQGASYCIATSADDSEPCIYKQDAFVPEKIIDSLGAGDTFNATVIYCLHKGLDVRKSVELGCKIASEKLKIRGFKGIRDAAQKCFQDIQ